MKINPNLQNFINYRVEVTLKLNFYIGLSKIYDGILISYSDSSILLDDVSDVTTIFSGEFGKKMGKYVIDHNNIEKIEVYYVEKDIHNMDVRKTIKIEFETDFF